ncbi:selenocysteine-specific translation elongation factor [Mycobacteroides abscessus]|uniref:selenocysteine-specific translation elongation factor n=1 Tax=Mycobacteroides abscessus TaxID=36809 RepID=UPI000C26BC06
MENHFTIGIAGHIDHGKTTLTKKLTNVDTDRLKEEKERGVSIELGFAPLQLPSGMQVGVVDVPGHERFIRQMIAGAAGIDLVILVIAADEGVMPQTREHFDIIRFLGIERGIIALTKKELVETEWLEMVTEEVREWVEGSFLEDAPILPVSAHTGDGIHELLQTIEANLSTIPKRDSTEPFRMPIDRVFTIKGAGAVVTGTIYEGQVSEGDIVEVYPLGERVKIRQLNVHHNTVATAYAGQRAALNLGGIDFKVMERGYALTAPDYFRKTDRLDIRFQMLAHHDFKLKQRTRVRLHIGTSELMAKIIFFDRNDLDPGDEVLCQLQLEEEIIAKPGDPFIVRRLSPTTTIGGGQVLSPYGVKRKFGEKTVELLNLLKGGDEWEMLQYVLSETGFATIEEIDFQLAFGMDRLKPLIQRYQEANQLEQFNDYIILADTLKEWTDKLKVTLRKYHKDQPMRVGMKKSELRIKLFPHLTDKLWREYIGWLKSKNIIEETDETVKMRSHKPELPAPLRAPVDKIISTLRKEGLAVSAWADISQKAGIKPNQTNEVKVYLIEQENFVAMGPDLIVDAATYWATVNNLQEQLPQGSPFSTPQVKDILNVSRKYLIPFLESLDDHGLTKRQENERIWIKTIPTK